jgi:hypothetical protein
MLRLLLQRGANIQLTAMGQNALDFAANAKVEKLLTDAGASKNAAIPVAAKGPVLDGGELVNAHYKPKVLVSYAANSGEEVALVETPAGPAMLTRIAGDMGLLHKSHWRDKQGDHFALAFNMPAGQGPGYEFIVPPDRMKYATMLIYRPGTYKAVKLDGHAGRRPLPRPSASYERITLIPR